MSNIIELKNIYKKFKKGQDTTIALDNVSMNIEEYKNVGIIGESGSGKTTLAKIMTKLIEPDSGKIIFNKKDITRLKRKDLKDFRNNVQIIFQDPYSSLDPKMTVRKLLYDFVKLRGGAPDEETLIKTLEKVALNSEILDKYPNALSGGQRQRVAIARVLTLNPRLIIADEPVSSLDASIRAQVLELLNELHLNSKITFVYITHDISTLSVIAKIAYVMYRGSIMEVSPVNQLIKEPLHPYTKALIAAIPDYDKNISEINKYILDVDDLDKTPPNGCKFYYRCPYATDKCKTEIPKLRKLQNGREVACHMFE